MKTLNVEDKHDVNYCIPIWLRDEQIKHATARVKGRIQANYESRKDTIAVVGFGPTLNDTWEEIKEFKYIITCSGSHKFLLEREIVPTYHVEVDPREHKVQLLGQPHKDVEYLIASTCHPKYFDHLEGMNVKLWHIFDATEEGLRSLPVGEWAITGGCDAGLRALTVSYFLGFRKLHVFGMDGCAKENVRHAAEHPNGKQPFAETEYEGKKYFTTPAMLTAAKQVFHELNQLKDIQVTFHGDGLIQEMAKKYKRQAYDNSMIAFSKPELISPEYVALNTQLHKENLAYGVGGSKHVDTVLKLAESMKTHSILDYGCGKGYLAKGIPFPIWEYDPAIEGKQDAPRPADLVVCTDVLEHIEPEKVHFVLGELKRCTKKVAYFVIHTGPAMKTLPDGRNTHLIQKGRKWWEKQLSKYFVIGKIFEVGPQLIIIVGAKKSTLMRTVKEEGVCI